MKRILILQNEILAYRKAIYNYLSKKHNTTIIHSGKQSINKTDSYDEIVLPKYSIGPFFFQKKLLSYIRKGNYDIIIAMFDLHWILNILLIFHPHKTPIIYWGHRYSENTLVNYVRNYILKKCDAVILYNDTEIERMVHNGINRNKIFVAENTIHVDNYENCSNYKKNSFLYVGRAQKRKKVDLLISSFASIVKEIPNNIIINIVGEGDENDYLEQLASDLNIKDRVFFHGSITSSERLKELFKNAFAYVSPDAIGLGAQHSFAYGVPVITIVNGYKGAEYDNLVNNHNAILYNHHDNLKKVLLSLINDRDLRQRLGSNAYNLYIEKLTIDKMAQGFFDAIEYVSK